jgi:RNA polymerase sigma factor (sigma-70 family)
MSPRLSQLLLRSQSDERLLSLASAGQEPAFATLVERYRSSLERYARRLVGEGSSDDVVQDAVLRAWIALDGGVEVHHARAWLYRIVHNVAMAALSRPGGRDEPLGEHLPAADDPAGEVERRMHARDVFARVAALPARQREALLLTAVAGVSGEQAADALGVSEGATRQLVHRARASLRSVATALTPLPFVDWAASGPAPTAAAVGGGAVAVKLCAAVAVTGAVAGGTVALLPGHSDQRVTRSQSAEAQAAPAVPVSRAAPLLRAAPPAASPRAHRSARTGQATGEHVAGRTGQSGAQGASTRAAGQAGRVGATAQSGGQGASAAGQGGGGRAGASGIQGASTR